MIKSYGNCSNNEKISEDNWCCELYGLLYGAGVPATTSPPHDAPCDQWTDGEKVDVGKVFESMMRWIEKVKYSD